MIKGGDQNELLSAMNKLFEENSYRKKLGQNAFALSSEYTWEKYKERLAKILNEN